MGLYFFAVGGFLLALVGLAMLVAAWELLLEREALHRLRRDRATFAASAPLPLVDGQAGIENAVRQAAMVGAAADKPGKPLPASVPAIAPRKDASWIETRPMVLNCPPAAEDVSVARRDEVDLLLG